MWMKSIHPFYSIYLLSVRTHTHTHTRTSLDAVVGTPKQCGSPAPPPPSPPPPGCASKTLESCMAACPAESGPWDGGFGGFASARNSFCSKCGNFGVADCAYVCAGGGSAGGGGGCDQTACSSGQYAFGADGWEITLTKAIAGGKTPYRAFAYLPFCHGKKIGSCVNTDAFSFSVSFRTDDFAGNRNRS